MRLIPALERLLAPISIAVFALVLGAVLASAGPDARASTSSPTTRPPSACSTGQPAYDTSFFGAGGFGLFYYPPTFIPLVLPFGLLRRDDGDLAVDRAVDRGVRDRRRRCCRCPGGRSG